MGANPDAFDPENFSREAEAARPVNAWKPFGNGQRACIGRGFAMHEAALAIGMILQRFKLIDVHRYQMHLKETLTMKPEGFKIKVRPRTDRDRSVPAARTAAVAVASSGPPLAQARPVLGTTRRCWFCMDRISEPQRNSPPASPTSPKSTACDQTCKP